MRRPYLVASVRVHRREGWTFGYTVDETGSWDAPNPPVSGYHLVVWEVRSSSKGAAIGILLHWLARDKPSIMEVREVWRDPDLAPVDQRARPLIEVLAEGED